MGEPRAFTIDDLARSQTLILTERWAPPQMVVSGYALGVLMAAIDGLQDRDRRERARERFDFRYRIQRERRNRRR